MKRILRKEVEVGMAFSAPENITIGFQPSRGCFRGCFSFWFEADGDQTEPEQAHDYIIAATGESFIKGKLRQTIVMPDGFHIFHLVQLD